MNDLCKLTSAYLELTKPRILGLVLITTVLGYFLGNRGVDNLPVFFWLLAGVTFACGGASALNQYLERDTDGLMRRTRKRPIPAGVIPPGHALSFGITLVLAGVFLLWWKVNLITSFLSLLTAFLYVLVYTPLKRVSWLNTTIGAIPGALPPVGGWTAATGHVGAGAWALFLVMFIWQHPHFYSIAWMCKEDYKKAGFKMLPVVEPDGKRTFRQIIFYSLLLIPVSLLPLWTNPVKPVCLTGAGFLGIFLLWKGIRLAGSASLKDAHQLLKASVVYLPALLFLIILDVAL